MNILLIAGGWSSERNVSLAGAKVITAALQSLGHTVSFFDPSVSLACLPLAVEGKDFTFINLHGSPGEDGLIQAMLETLRCPYQGSGPAASMLALNKAVTKSLYRKAGLPTADWVLLTAKPEPGWMPDLPFPLFIKPNTGGSSLHMEMVATPEALPQALERLFANADTFIIEPAVAGAELTCGVLGVMQQGKEKPEALPPILIKPKAASGIFDYQSKYALGGAEEICPAPLPPALTKTIQEMALAAHTVLGLSGYSRSDFILSPTQGPILLETNTLPGMTPTSLLPQEAAAVGLSFAQLLERLIALGLNRG